MFRLAEVVFVRRYQAKELTAFDLVSITGTSLVEAERVIQWTLTQIPGPYVSLANERAPLRPSSICAARSSRQKPPFTLNIAHGAAILSFRAPHTKLKTE